MRSQCLRSAVLLSAAGSLLLLSGCGTSATVSNPGQQTAAAAVNLAGNGATNVFAAVDNATPVVVQYGARAGSTGSLVNSFNESLTGDLEAIAVDQSTGTIYATGLSTTDGQPEIYAYPAGSTGTAAPTRTIKLSLTATTEPYDITTDASGNVYVVTFDTSSGAANVLEYAPTATGTATPLKDITGSLTGLIEPIAVAVDSAGTIYVSSINPNTAQGTILEFSSVVTGNVAPLRTITSSNYQFYGLAVDSSFNLYASEVLASNTAVASQIVEYPQGSTTPSKTITSPAIYAATGLKVDAAGNIYTLNYEVTSNSAYATILAFGPTASGYINPSLTLTPAALNSYTTYSLAIQ